MKMARMAVVVIGGAVLVALWWAGLFDSSTASAESAEPIPFGPTERSYSLAFEEERKRIGEITPEEFSKRYAHKTPYLPKLTWDPTTAKYWDRFQLDPNAKGAKIRVRGAEEARTREWAKEQGEPLPDVGPIYLSAEGGFDFRLNPEELATFRRNGFVVSERMGASSCTEMFYRIYKRDLPVFVTTDAILHAWHRSYDALLVEVELSMLIPALDGILEAMSEELARTQKDYGRVGQRHLRDADYFLTVARSLLLDRQLPSPMGQQAKVAETLEACRAQKLQSFELFGKHRKVDFSQMKPRGHYEKSPALQRYFRAMMWLGRIDMRVAGDPGQASPRQLGAALVLYDLLQRSGQFETWQELDNIMQTFVGTTDSMTFAQLRGVLGQAKLDPAEAIEDEQELLALQKVIAEAKVGAQQIRGHVYDVTDSPSMTYVLPHSFTFLGQKLTVDSWVTSKVVFDDVIREGKQVVRRIPSCLDVAFAALGNDHVVPLLTQRINNPAGRQFRDGLEYQHNLAAVREVLDQQPASQWSDNIYTGWLGSLRELSRPTTEKNYPEVMRTRAWAMKSTNTQLASWSQLRHDTILYVKQSSSGMAMCYYPAGYVEPVPHFWSKLAKTIENASEQLAKTKYFDAGIQKKHTKFLRGFASKVRMLEAISEKELAQKALTPAETKFLEDIIEKVHVRVGSGSRSHYDGWYPGLFYKGADDSAEWDALVADIHTNPPSPFHGDPGCVLHQGVGSVDLLMIAVDNGQDRMIFAGPVLSHYEFEMPGVTRKADSEWQEELRKGKAPPRPEWTREYLVPGVNERQLNYR